MKYQIKVFHKSNGEIIQDALVSCDGTRKVSMSGNPTVVDNLKKGIIWRGKKYTSDHGIRFLEAISLSLGQNHYLSATEVREIS